MSEKIKRAIIPAIHPNWARAHDRDNTPDPITAVMICALAVIKVPSTKSKACQKEINEVKPNKKSGNFFTDFLRGDVEERNLKSCMCRKSSKRDTYIYIPVRFLRPSSSNLELMSPDSTAKLETAVCVSIALFLSLCQWCFGDMLLSSKKWLEKNGKRKQIMYKELLLSFRQLCFWKKKKKSFRELYLDNN